MNYTFEARREIYTNLWASMNIRPERLAIITRQADKILSFKDRYDPIEKATGVPWYIIGLMHLRESNFDFDTHLHNGDPLSERTYHVPAGRPISGSPPFTFEESAIDAMRQKGYDKVSDWSIERIAFTLEKYNGFGYIQYGINSPYLWAGTDLYSKGKFVRDHVFSASYVDTQLGTMAVIRVILDKLGNPLQKTHTEIAKQAPKAEPERPTTTSLAKVSRKAWYTRLLQYFGIGGGGTSIGLKIADSMNIEATKSTLDKIKDFAQSYGTEATIVVCTGIVCFTLYMLKLQKDDIVEGRAVPSGDDEKEPE